MSDDDSLEKLQPDVIHDDTTGTFKHLTNDSFLFPKNLSVVRSENNHVFLQCEEHLVQ